MSSCSFVTENKRCCQIIAGVTVAVLALIGLLIGISFSYLDYYQMGFKRQKSTGSVSLGKVYMSGRYFIGPDFEFKTFPADGQYVTLSKVTIFTADKLELKVTINFQYFLRSDELVKLHNKFDLSYQPIMKTSALDAVKGTSAKFTTREFILKRASAEEAMYKAVRERLGGTCCRPKCDTYSQACPIGCKPYSQCTDTDKGIFVDVKYFQLGYVDIPTDVEDRFLTALTLQAEAEREHLLQEASVVRKNTTAMVQELQNAALEIKESGNAIAGLISATAQANYTNILESARAQGLKQAFTLLGLNTQETKNSFDYLRTLRKMPNAHFTVDFQQRIVGNLK